MVNTTKNNSKKSITNPKTPEPSHKIRTFFAGIIGALAAYLIIASITVVWLNRTLTDTNTYVHTVSSLVTEPAIQHFVADKVTDQIIQNAPTMDLAKELLPPSAINAAPTLEMLKAPLKTMIERNVLQIVQSPQFASLWQETNHNAHAALVSQLNNSNAEVISLDLSPAINGVVDQLKSTELKPIAKNLKLKPDAGKLEIKSDKIAKIHNFYKIFKDATLAIVIIAVLMIALSIWLSVHHGKTARRILFTTGTLALIQGLLLEAPTVAKFSNNAAEQEAARAFAQVLLHNLQVASIVVGVLCIVAAIGSKLYVKYKH